MTKWSLYEALALGTSFTEGSVLIHEGIFFFAKGGNWLSAVSNTCLSLFFSVFFFSIFLLPFISEMIWHCQMFYFFLMLPVAILALKLFFVFIFFDFFFFCTAIGSASLQVYGIFKPYLIILS